MHRFQTVAFNLAFGVWFISAVLTRLPTCPVLAGISSESAQACYNTIMPQITPNNLILLGLSAGTYAALKTTENKPAPMPNKVSDESGLPPAKG
jgi:ABC-type thiamin/hydroxymethylpyrimidine transport system permease subunit